MEGSKRTPRKPKCSVWQYWETDVAADGVNLVRCKFCSHEYTASVAKNATRLRQHLTRRCPRVPDEVKVTFPEESDEKIKLTKTPEKSDNNLRSSKRKIRKPVVPDVKSEPETEDDFSKDDISIVSEPSREVTKNMKTLEEENQKLSSKLKICLEQKEALLKINHYLDQSLSLMVKLDSLQKNYTTNTESKIDELTHELNSCNNSVKDWKQKYNLIEYKHKMKTTLKNTRDSSGPKRSLKWSVDNTSKGHRPQSTIWKHFKILSKDSDKLKIIKCVFCEKEFRYKHLNATKCRTHIVENCESVPEDIRREENKWIEYRPQSKINIWQHFTVTEEDDKTTVECVYCNHVYARRNATKCRSHLVGKCENVPENIKEAIAGQCDIDFINNSQITPKTKMSAIWKHYDIEEEDGKISCICIYCRHLFSYKNATKSRKHLTDKCPAIPRDIRLEISSETEEYGRTWTQTKIPIWDYFETETIRGKESVRCIYCGYTYGHKNTTKLRMHLLSKCEDIPNENREQIRDQCEKSYLNGMRNKSDFNLEIKEKKVRKVYKRRETESKGTKPKCFIWEHFKDCSDTGEEGTAIRVECKFCSHSFNYRNATKMRQHLANMCKSVPQDIKERVREFDEGSVRAYKRRIQQSTGMHECCWPGCDFKFAKMSRLKVHQLSHTGAAQRIRCDWPGCEWTGRTKSDVKIHRCIHTGEKPYVCDWPGCDFKTAKPSSLWIHKRRHKELFNYPCDWPGCERRFLAAWERTRHKNTHLGLKPYACEYCDKRYPIAYKLKVHQNKHHLNQMALQRR